MNTALPLRPPTTVRAYRIRAGCVAALAIALLAGLPAQAQITTLPPVVVTAPTASGSTVICYGTACESVLRELQAQYWQQQHQTHQPPLQEQLVDVPVIKPVFCQKLRDSKPATCGTSVPPAPGINISIGDYQQTFADGCANLAWNDLLGDALHDRFPTFNGDLDEPVAGMNFRAICSTHDTCYAALGMLDECDGALASSMQGLCATQTGSALADCEGAAGAYMLTVQMRGETAYDATVRQYNCALWHKNMVLNQCRQ